MIRAGNVNGIDNIWLMWALDTAMANEPKKHEKYQIVEGWRVYSPVNPFKAEREDIKSMSFLASQMIWMRLTVAVYV